MPSQLKKFYTAPQLTVHGKVQEITLQAGMQNADTPIGVNNAFPNAA